MNCTFRTGFAVACVGMLMAFTAVRAGEEELKERLKTRHEQVVQLKTLGKVGETAAGYLEIVDKTALADPKIKTLVDAENSDRKELYAVLAEAEKATAEEVGRQNAILKFTRAGREEYFRGKDGDWRTKIQMLQAPGKQ